MAKPLIDENTTALGQEIYIIVRDNFILPLFNSLEAEEITPPKIAATLTFAMDQCGINAATIITGLPTNKATLSKWKNGHAKPGPIVCKAIITLLRKELPELLTPDDQIALCRLKNG